MIASPNFAVLSAKSNSDFDDCSLRALIGHWGLVIGHFFLLLLFEGIQQPTQYLLRFLVSRLACVVAIVLTKDFFRGE